MKIALFKGRGLLSWLIRFQTRGEYSHAAFLFDDGTVYEAWQGKGVQRLPALKAGTEGMVLYDAWLSEGQVVALRTWLQEQLGKAYDYSGVLNFVTRVVPERDNGKFFCSKLIVMGMERVGKALFREAAAWEIAPDKVRWSLVLRRLGEEEQKAFLEQAYDKSVDSI